MAVELYPHNQTAYRSALEMLEKSGKAAVVHPTGTGKSFIAFKLAEEHPGMRIIWLAPSEYIFRSQKENYLETGGDEATLSGVTFLTYAKLMHRMLGMDGSLVTGEPDYIVLDEFHRCGAEGWGRGVETLLEAYPAAKVLGLSATHIRYLDSRRDMAQELFGGRIASRMGLGEAMAEGILPAPLYICGLYEYKSELRKISRRVRRQRNIGVRDGSAELLEKLRHCLQNAEGPREIFGRHMRKDGKYIIFCSGRRHMEEMISLAGEWFGELDKEPRIYRAIYDSKESPEEVRQFRKDNSGHLKLLYCIDMLNEGVHVADVDGVVLLRPTASPTLYLQQIGRALSVPGRRPHCQSAIFDLVDNFDGLKCIDSFLEEYHRVSAAEGEGRAEKPKYSFRLLDEARDSRVLFEQIIRCLSSSWETCFGEAEKYYEKYGDLKIPKRYVTEDGIALGSWLLTQRRVRAGTVPGNLSKEQIERLDRIGMDWESRVGKAWETGYRRLAEFREENGHMDVPCRYVTEDGYPLGKFVSNQRTAWRNSQRAEERLQAEKNGRPVPSDRIEVSRTALRGRTLTAERKRKLDALGFIWDKSEQGWERYYAAAKAFYEREGHLDVPVKFVTEDGLRLGDWLQAKISAKNSLPEDKRKALEAIGVTWGSKYDVRWKEKYRLAEQFYRKHGHLEIPRDYMAGDVRLGRWVSALRSARARPGTSHYCLDKERIRQLDAIGMRWASDSWEVRFRLAERYYQEHGDLKVSQAYVTEAEGQSVWLGKWLAGQRKKHNSPGGKHDLTEEQARRLEEIGMEW